MKAIILATPALGALLALTACGEPLSTDVLKARVADHVASDPVCNKRANVEYLPRWCQGQLAGQRPIHRRQGRAQSVRSVPMASVIEAMLNTDIMQVVIEPTGDIDTPYYGLARQRAEVLQGMISKVAFVPFHRPIPIQMKSTGSAAWGSSSNGGELEPAAQLDRPLSLRRRLAGTSGVLCRRQEPTVNASATYEPPESLMFTPPGASVSRIP